MRVCVPLLPPPGKPGFRKLAFLWFVAKVRFFRGRFFSRRWGAVLNGCISYPQPSLTVFAGASRLETRRFLGQGIGVRDVVVTRFRGLYGERGGQAPRREQNAGSRQPHGAGRAYPRENDRRN